MASITILYPSGHQFDVKYYMQTHMPLVSASWGGAGLKSWEITQFAPDQQYQIQAILEFESMAAWEAASTGESAVAVFGDIPNFTAAKPVVVKGAHLGSEKLA
ncbi:ethyl tert-butyl ether degradation EthD [Metarhizium album ARSEF 1941]|uniref:Ethyl tert-butyl ether degradation EthD n=1 Tax=Metarhizium album (strain ARSEF 1941) TaxID=1081103 RepID=A0A0B2WYX7_METAS|nr:ethyl tert-butyl ether degradation EthD [Metarhizium album ARSEF 1941]KHN98642.1 ethyl tert-butyl ether degradation EthD [Metarhizium album ARSEF 1941]